MIWGEPSRKFQWALDSALGSQTIAPRAYAEILDASYGALKAVNSANLVIGGDTFTTGHIGARQQQPRGPREDDQAVPVRVGDPHRAGRGVRLL